MCIYENINLKLYLIVNINDVLMKFSKEKF